MIGSRRCDDVIDIVEDEGDAKWRLLGRSSRLSICIDAVGRRPQPGDRMQVHYGRDPRTIHRLRINDEVVI